MSVGWIKLHRSLLDWEWYDDINATRLLIHLLISVNYEDKQWKGEIIKSGSMVFSWEKLSVKTGLSIQQLRSSMTKLENSREVTRYTTNKYQVVTLLKWDKLQDYTTQATDKPTSKQQTNNRQITTTKEIKNKRSKEIYRSFFHLSISVSEYEKLLENYSKENIDNILDDIENYSSNKKYKSLYLTANNWLSKKFKETKVVNKNYSFAELVEMENR